MSKLAIVLIAYAPLALLRGWVIALLWGWYVTDYFGLKALTIIEAVGLGILFTAFHIGKPTNDEKPIGYEIAYYALVPLLALLFGWLWSFSR